jgi:hypothetical protein
LSKGIVVESNSGEGRNGWDSTYMESAIDKYEQMQLIGLINAFFIREGNHSRTIE